jgi:hypothetical protein
MGKIYSYQIVSDAYTTYRANLGESGQELATIDGITYVFVPGELPEQPAEIAVIEVTLDTALKEAIKAASPHCQLISSRMEERIRARYPVSAEQYFSRIGVGVALGVYAFQPGEQEELLAFGAFVEEVRQWGREQRAELGL